MERLRRNPYDGQTDVALAEAFDQVEEGLARVLLREDQHFGGPLPQRGFDPVFDVRDWQLVGRDDGNATSPRSSARAERHGRPARCHRQ